MNKLRRIFFNLLRSLFWIDYNPNEDFTCMNCGKEMYHRYLCCSPKCTEEQEKMDLIAELTKNLEIELLNVKPLDREKMETGG